MKEFRAFLSTKDEIEEILQEALDDKTIRLEQNLESLFDKNGNSGRFYEAYSPAYDNRLDGAQVDERIADKLGVPDCEHWIVDDINVVILVGKISGAAKEEEV